jgi:hypothetical protein
MAARVYSQFPERKLGTPKQSTDHASGPKAATGMPMKTAGYPTAGAKGGVGYNRATKARVVPVYPASAGLS